MMGLAARQGTSLDSRGTRRDRELRRYLLLLTVALLVNGGLVALNVRVFTGVAWAYFPVVFTVVWLGLHYLFNVRLNEEAPTNGAPPAGLQGAEVEAETWE